MARSEGAVEGGEFRILDVDVDVDVRGRSLKKSFERGG